MAVKFRSCTCYEPYDKVDKAGTLSTLSGLPWIEIKAWDQIDDVTCEFIVSGFNHTHNYMEVDWGDTIYKTYFVNKRTGMPGNMVKLTCEIDVLTTYGDIIRRSPAVIARTNNSAFVNFYQRDEKVPTLSTTDISTKNFGSAILPSPAQEYIYAGIWLTRSSSEVEE